MLPTDPYIALAVALIGLAFVAGRAWHHRRQQAVVITRTWQKLNRDQIAKHLAGWGETDPRWRALWDLYGEEFEAVLMELHQLPSTMEAMLEWRGRMQMVLHLRSQLLSLRGAPQAQE